MLVMENQTVGQRLRREREAQGISRLELARYMGVATSTLSDLELDASKSTTKLHLAAERLGVLPRWLETGKGPKTESDLSQPARLDMEKLRQAIEVAMAMRGPLLAENIAAAYELLTREVVTSMPTRRSLGNTRGEGSGIVEGRDSGTGVDSGSTKHQGKRKA